MGADAAIRIEQSGVTPEDVQHVAYKSVPDWVEEYGCQCELYLGVGPEIHVECVGRYWSPSYPRGNWPTLRKVLLALMTRWPAAIVRYGNDYGTWDVVTKETIRGYDKIWKESLRR